MTTNTLPVTGLDFASNLANLKTYLQSQTIFQDYNFDGSNLSVLLGLLAYNTYMNGFYTNQTFNETFLDSALKLDSVLSRAKELNYLPRSYTSAVAFISLTVNPNDNPTTINVPAGTAFTAKLDDAVYTFTTRDTLVITNTGSGFIASNVAIYEGSPVTESFVFSASNTDQRFVLSNPSIDTESLSVNVQTSNTNIEYKYEDSLLDLKATDNVYFLQSASGGNYELVFGNGVTGAALQDQNVIVANYSVSSGDTPNGCAVFTPSNTVGGYSNVIITTLAVADGGAIAEDINSIKFNAPRHYQTQERAVATNDFKTLLTREFPAIRALNVFGGEDMNPPQYGSVIVSVDIKGADGLSNSWRSKISSFLQDKMTLGIVPVIISPAYLYAKVVVNTNYNINMTSLSPANIAAMVSNTIENFENTYLDDFNVTLYHSRLSTAIDNTDASIVNNNLQLYIAQKLTPLINQSQTFNFTYDNQINPGSVQSTLFSYGNYPNCYLADDSKGNLNITTLDSSNNVVTALSGVGKINYATGDGSLTGFTISGYSGLTLDIIATPTNPDITADKNNVLRILPSDIIVNATAVRA